jgi:hypothetical protein
MDFKASMPLSNEATDCRACICSSTAAVVGKSRRPPLVKRLCSSSCSSLLISSETEAWLVSNIFAAAVKDPSS